jgi:hypothetical protein
VRLGVPEDPHDSRGEIRDFGKPYQVRWRHDRGWVSWVCQLIVAEVATPDPASASVLWAVRRNRRRLPVFPPDPVPEGMDEKKVLAE